MNIHNVCVYNRRTKASKYSSLFEERKINLLTAFISDLFYLRMGGGKIMGKLDQPLYRFLSRLLLSFLDVSENFTFINFS